MLSAMFEGQASWMAQPAALVPQAGVQSLGGSPVGILLYVKDVDATVEKAVAAGGKLERPVKDQFYGDRSGQIRDPFGHMWWVSTHKEDVPPEEMEKRAAAAYNQK